jgi:ethanolamine ammonia-lyase small subunit
MHRVIIASRAKAAKGALVADGTADVTPNHIIAGGCAPDIAHAQQQKNLTTEHAEHAEECLTLFFPRVLHVPW